MTDNDFLSEERVIVATEEDSIAGFCTLTERDELADKYNFSPFIGFIFVDERYRGKRISQKMIEAALPYVRSLGYDNIYIMSDERGLYEKFGFEKTGDYETIYGTLDQLFVRHLEEQK